MAIPSRFSPRMEEARNFIRHVIAGLVGISTASLIRGCRHGLREFMAQSHSTALRVQPFESGDIASLPIKALNEILDGKKVTITCEVQPYVDGMLPWTEAFALLSIIKAANPPAVLEIGTYNGATTRALAQNLPESVIHTLDLPSDYNPGADSGTMTKDGQHLIAKREPGREFLNTPEAARIRQHFGDSATWDFSQAAGTNCFFIDGAHTYEYCKSDTEKCFELCGGKGLFFWHDCEDGTPGVVKFLAEWRRMGRDIVRIRDTNLAYWDGR